MDSCTYMQVPFERGILMDVINSGHGHTSLQFHAWNILSWSGCHIFFLAYLRIVFLALSSSLLCIFLLPWGVQRTWTHELAASLTATSPKGRDMSPGPPFCFYFFFSSLFKASMSNLWIMFWSFFLLESRSGVTEARPPHPQAASLVLKRLPPRCTTAILIQVLDTICPARWLGAEPKSVDVDVDRCSM